MSVHNDKKTTQRTPVNIMQSKGKEKLTMLTAYDYCTALLLDQSGLDMLLVGDSLGMVMLGREDTISVTLDEMILHCNSVKQAVKNAMVVADMPFMSYECGIEDALKNASKIFKETSIRAVKLEGGKTITPQVKAMVEAGIPVMGHIGLTPQRMAVLGGFKVQGKSSAAAVSLLEDALALEAAGCFAIVLEAIPAPIAAYITQNISIPTIGIGAGPDCDGQVLVIHDVLGLYDRFTPKFVKKFAELGKVIKDTAESYCNEVKNGAFPAPEHCFNISDAEMEMFRAEADRVLGKCEE